MYARALDRPEIFNGTRQLAFQGALIVHLLGELADAKLLLIEQFKAHAATLRQPLLGQLHAHLMHL